MVGFAVFSNSPFAAHYVGSGPILCKARAGFSTASVDFLRKLDWPVVLFARGTCRAHFQVVPKEIDNIDGYSHAKVVRRIDDVVGLDEHGASVIGRWETCCVHGREVRIEKRRILEADLVDGTRTLPPKIRKIKSAAPGKGQKPSK